MKIIRIEDCGECYYFDGYGCTNVEGVYDDADTDNCPPSCPLPDEVRND